MQVLSTACFWCSPPNQSLSQLLPGYCMLLYLVYLLHVKYCLVDTWGYHVSFRSIWFSSFRSYSFWATERFFFSVLILVVDLSIYHTLIFSLFYGLRWGRMIVNPILSQLFWNWGPQFFYYIFWFFFCWLVRAFNILKILILYHPCCSMCPLALNFMKL